MKSRNFAVVILFLIVGICSSASACPSCYGAADSPLTAGMDAAILVMLGITGVVLSMIVGVFLFLWRRAHRRSAEISNQTFVDDQGLLKTNKEKGVVEWNNF